MSKGSKPCVKYCVGVNKFVFDTLVYCWEERIEVGGLIDREPLELPVKPEGFGEDKEVTKQWSYHMQV